MRDLSTCIAFNTLARHWPQSWRREQRWQWRSERRGCMETKTEQFWLCPWQPSDSLHSKDIHWLTITTANSSWCLNEWKMKKDSVMSSMDLAHIVFKSGLVIYQLMRSYHLWAQRAVCLLDKQWEIVFFEKQWEIVSIVAMLTMAWVSGQ